MNRTRTVKKNRTHSLLYALIVLARLVWPDLYGVAYAQDASPGKEKIKEKIKQLKELKRMFVEGKFYSSRELSNSKSDDRPRIKDFIDVYLPLDPDVSKSFASALISSGVVSSPPDEFDGKQFVYSWKDTRNSFELSTGDYGLSNLIRLLDSYKKKNGSEDIDGERFKLIYDAIIDNDRRESSKYFSDSTIVNFSFGQPNECFCFKPIAVERVEKELSRSINRFEAELGIELTRPNFSQSLYEVIVSNDGSLGTEKNVLLVLDLSFSTRQGLEDLVTVVKTWLDGSGNNINLNFMLMKKEADQAIVFNSFDDLFNRFDELFNEIKVFSSYVSWVLSFEDWSSYDQVHLITDFKDYDNAIVADRDPDRYDDQRVLQLGAHIKNQKFYTWILKKRERETVDEYLDVLRNLYGDGDVFERLKYVIED